MGGELSRAVSGAVFVRRLRAGRGGGGRFGLVRPVLGGTYTVGCSGARWGIRTNKGRVGVWGGLGLLREEEDTGGEVGWHRVYCAFGEEDVVDGFGMLIP